MKKLLYLILVFPYLASGQITDDEQRSIWQSESIQKVIKTVNDIDTTCGLTLKVIKEVATLNDKGHIISYESYDKLDKLNSRSTHKLKNDTVLQESRHISFFSGRRSVWDTNHKYNKKNKLKYTEHFIDDRLTTKFKYCYNKDGTLKSQRQNIYTAPNAKNFNVKIENKYLYDDNKKLKQVLSNESKNGNTISESIQHSTSKDGQIKTEHKLNTEINEKVLLRKLLYNSANKLLEKHSFFHKQLTINGVQYKTGDVKITKYSYNNKGLVTKVDRYKNENLLYTKSYIYEYFNLSTIYL